MVIIKRSIFNVEIGVIAAIAGIEFKTHLEIRTEMLQEHVLVPQAKYQTPVIDVPLMLNEFRIL